MSEFRKFKLSALVSDQAEPHSSLELLVLRSDKHFEETLNFKVWKSLRTAEYFYFGLLFTVINNNLLFQLELNRLQPTG